MNTGGGIEARHVGAAGVLATEVECAVHGVRAIADADGEHGADACFKRGFEHRFSIGVVARAVEVRVGVGKGRNLGGH